MEELMKRYNELLEPIKDWPGAKIRDFVDKKLTEAPTEKLLATFAKKLTACEKKQEEANEWLPKLRAKCEFVRDILRHPYYDEGKMSADFNRTMNGIQKKLEAFEWDGDTLLKGKPFKPEVSAINTDHLKKAWEKLLPKPVLMDAAKFETFVSTANKCIDQFRPIFLQKGCGEKLEEWNTIESECRQKLQEDGVDTVDVMRLKAIYDDLGKFIPKQKASPPKKKNKKKDWTALRDAYIKRAKPRQFRQDKSAYAKYEQLDDLFQEAHEAKNTEKMEKYYCKIDALLPKEGSFKQSVLETADVAQEEIPGTIYSDDEAIVDSDEEDEEEDEDEEEEYESSSSSVEEKPAKLAKGKKRARNEDTLGEVLTVFSGTNPDIEKLRKLYDENGDDSDFDSELKRIKDSRVDRYQVQIYGKGTGVRIPCLPGESVFFSQEEANEAGENYVKTFNLHGSYEVKIVHLKPGAKPE